MPASGMHLALYFYYSSSWLALVHSRSSHLAPTFVRTSRTVNHTRRNHVHPLSVTCCFPVSAIFSRVILRFRGLVKKIKKYLLFFVCVLAITLANIVPSVRFLSGIPFNFSCPLSLSQSFSPSLASDKNIARLPAPAYSVL